MNDLGKPRFYRKKPQTRVTIIIGIICQKDGGGIVLVSDSQTTAGSAKRTDTNKMSVLPIKGRDVMVAESGDALLSARAVEVMRQKLSQTEFDDYRKPADIAQEAIMEVKKELSRLNDWDLATRDQYFNDNPFSLMIAYYFQPGTGKPKPHLFTINSVPGIAILEKNYAAIGCGATVGEFIISRSSAWTGNLADALVMGVYAVEEVKKVDAFCGGPTKAAVLGPHKVVTSEDDAKKYIKAAVTALANYEEELKANWQKLLGKMKKKINVVFNDLIKPPDSGETPSE